MTEIIVLCGSSRFKSQFADEMRRLTLEGNIVLTLGRWAHSENIELSSKEMAGLEKLQRQKIRLASRVHVINVGGYIGRSTAEEIVYAKEQGKIITYLDPASVLAPSEQEKITRLAEIVADMSAEEPPVEIITRAGSYPPVLSPTENHAEVGVEFKLK